MVFEKLFEESNNIESFSDSLSKNFQAVADLYEMPYRNQLEQQESIEKFILLKNKIISSYSYTNTQSRSFLLILLDFCERFGLYSCIPHVLKIIRNNNIAISKRMSAGIKVIVPRPTSNKDLVNRFDDICILLNEAIEEEEDNDKKSIVTLLNYYDHIVINTNSACIKQVKENIDKLLSEERFLWLSKISNILNIDTSDPEIIHERIEEKIDIILD